MVNGCRPVDVSKLFPVAVFNVPRKCKKKHVEGLFGEYGVVAIRLNPQGTAVCVGGLGWVACVVQGTAVCVGSVCVCKARPCAWVACVVQGTAVCARWVVVQLK